MPTATKNRSLRIFQKRARRSSTRQAIFVVQQAPKILLTIDEIPARHTSMKVSSSLKTLKKRDRNCQVVRRKGRLYVINKRNPRFKARQG